jgi:hypothetical protein
VYVQAPSARIGFDAKEPNAGTRAAGNVPLLHDALERLVEEAIGLLAKLFLILS